MRKNKNLIYIAGPTGVGKTDLSIEIAKKFNTDIVSCDSRQFYKELKIGTSPPSYSQLKEVKHHFIHHKSIHDVYNVGKYEKDAITVINDLFKEKDNLILVGGSGLYADSIMFGIDDFPDVPLNMRNNIIANFKSGGLESIQNKLNYQGEKKKDKTLELTGCSIKELKAHLETNFKDVMSWDNYKHDGWHMDHIRPCASFDLTDKKQQLVCFNWRNLAPAWANENIRKSDTYEPIDEVEWSSWMVSLDFEGDLFLMYEEGRGGL